MSPWRLIGWSLSAISLGAALIVLTIAFAFVLAILKAAGV